MTNKLLLPANFRMAKEAVAHFSASATYRTFLRSMTENTIIRDHTLAMTNRTRLSSELCSVAAIV